MPIQILAGDETVLPQDACCISRPEVMGVGGGVNSAILLANCSYWHITFKYEYSGPYSSMCR
jgi:hypothetical protein